MRPVDGIDERSETGDVGIGGDAKRMARHVRLNNVSAAFAQAVQLANEVTRPRVASAFQLIALLQRPLHSSVEVALHVRATQPGVNREEVGGGELGRGLGVVCRVPGHRTDPALIGWEDDASSTRRIVRSSLWRVPFPEPGVEAHAGNCSHHVCIVEARRRKVAEKVQRGPGHAEQAAKEYGASHGALYAALVVQRPLQRASRSAQAAGGGGMRRPLWSMRGSR